MGHKDTLERTHFGFLSFLLFWFVERVCVCVCVWILDVILDIDFVYCVMFIYYLLFFFRILVSTCLITLLVVVVDEVSVFS